MFSCPKMAAGGEALQLSRLLETKGYEVFPADNRHLLKGDAAENLQRVSLVRGSALEFVKILNAQTHLTIR